jgi:hypothetical protein
VEVEPEETVLSDTTSIELVDEVFTCVGGISLFWELGLNSADDKFSEQPFKDIAWEAELADSPLTHASVFSLFLEHFVQPTKVVFSKLHSMEPEGEVFPTAGGMPQFLEERLGSTNVCDAVLIKDVTGSDEVLTHVGGLSLFLECGLDLSVASVNQVLHDDLPWKYHALFPWRQTGKGGILLLANMAQTTFRSGHNGMQAHIW